MEKEFSCSVLNEVDVKQSKWDRGWISLDDIIEEIEHEIGTRQSSWFIDGGDNSSLSSNNFCNITGILRFRSNGTIQSVFRIRWCRRFLLDEWIGAKRRFSSALDKIFGWWKSWEKEESVGNCSTVVFNRGGVKQSEADEATKIEKEMSCFFNSLIKFQILFVNIQVRSFGGRKKVSRLKQLWNGKNAWVFLQKY